ncbi:MAG: hypothetical protein CSA33_09260 [Desulfobulbus propionicus]|nr:MAG: hypothetical protein CSA33_09260 [Desulfobulbus propionicus]
MEINGNVSRSQTLPLLIVRKEKTRSTGRGITPVEEYLYSDRGAAGVKSAVIDSVAVVITLQDKTGCRELVKKIRSDPATALKPVFLTTAYKGEELLLGDGTVSSMSEASEKAAPILQRLASINVEQSDEKGDIFLLLSYLYSRPEQQLVPVVDWQTKEVYRYPLADVLLGDGESNLRQLESLRDRGLISQGRLIDRIRHCPHCNGCHLNFVDICPQCGSINILQQQFLHCFTCGHVTGEDGFITPAGLECPNCRTKLRHIGTDYDRALENYFCRDCRASFCETGVVARCHHCLQAAKPEELIPRNIYSFQLTEQGSIAARTGSLENVYAILDTLNNITPIYFNHFLDWALQLSKRYPEAPFNLIGIRLSNILELTNTLGRQRLWELMDEFVTRIRNIVRNTDLTCRTTQQDLWLLLPRISENGCHTLQERILEIKELSWQPEGVGLEFSMVTCIIPEEVDEQEDAKLLIARLQGALS